MKYVLVVQDEAEKDITAAYIWYEEKSYGLGDKFLKEVDNSFLLILEAPERYGFFSKRPHFRRKLLSRFPYRIFYETEGNLITVVRVLHTKQENKF